MGSNPAPFPPQGNTENEHLKVIEFNYWEFLKIIEIIFLIILKLQGHGYGKTDINSNSLFISTSVMMWKQLLPLINININLYTL